MTQISDNDSVIVADDVCALALVRRLAAMVDRDPASLDEGDALPRGWHPTMFNPPTRQSQLRHDGAADLGVKLPDIGLPRLMLGGRQNRFLADIPIGARVRRESRQGGVQMKQGRSGRFALVKVEHRIFVAGSSEPALIEVQDYVLREAAAAATTLAAVPVAAPAAADVAPAAADVTSAAAVVAAEVPEATRVLLPDQQLLFRFSAITDNPHRIHYDQPYATAVEGYPALVVNGSIPGMFLLELFRASVGREPAALASRNLAPMFCGQPLHLNLRQDGAAWRLWAQDAQGNTCYDARVE